MSTKMMARWALRLTGAEITAAITLFDVLIWVFSSDALQEWCERCYFGVGESKSKYATVKEMEDGFDKAIAEVDIAPPPPKEEAAP